MEKIIFISVFIFIIGLITIITALKNAKQGKLTPIKFRHIQGMPNLMEGEIVKISSDEKSIKIDNKYSIPKDRIKFKTTTNSKMLTEKQKSVIKRSLVGIAVAGPLGGIIGGISGIGTKQTTELVHFLTIKFIDILDVEHTALFALEDVSHLMYLNRFANS